MIYVKLFDENKAKTTIEIIKEVEKTAISYSKKVETIEVLTSAIKLIMIDSNKYIFINLQASPTKSVNNYCVAIEKENENAYQLLANDTTKYFLANIFTEENGNSKLLYNCCLKKVYGKDSFAIYQFGLEWNTDLAVVALPKVVIYGKYYLVNNSYFTRQNVWKTTMFRACSIIKENMKAEKEGWTFNETSTQEQKIEVWKKYIDAWEQCKQNTPSTQ